MQAVAKAPGAGLELGQRGGLRVLGGEPVLEGLLEPLGFSLGLGVVRLAVLLGDAQAPQLGFQAVAAAFAAGKPGGEDHAVVGQGGGRGAVSCDGGPEGGQDDAAGDAFVRGDGQGVPGVVAGSRSGSRCPSRRRGGSG